ncbi:tRNA dimethylallyltransferase [Candidatus Xiphinematobacter sp. Idaho Grape]|uniref:tRNA (adenosine(37)-N6)-dimethylallyltransferase MiaA n=1 Tax=Candidatus Xiphinematobacter sp. Idaho Grape TaxID=1704307 RepID=UPI0007067E8B|nr:tRNA (adenosine(37)-N6)-dimethylallyltransferase MiaA [Candidatus Xiphinematobacter sp. Idaho Grape]ALJ56233.1 tRNA dimethylallyltransferase [Candidatus Xiphinematobacter sp. Idaho Grape]
MEPKQPKNDVRLYSSLPQPIFLAGPTGVGKSALAVELARRIRGEIIGADAFQVYSGLSILTAQPDQTLLEQVPHHLIGHISAEEDYHAWRYRSEACEKITDILQRGRTPIVVGGTGLYFRALIQGLDPIPASNLVLRSELEQLSLEMLLERLDKADPHANKRVDIRNRRRVLRAVEICELSGKPLESFRTKSRRVIATRAFVLVRAREELYRNIVGRVHHMWERGVVREVGGMRGQIGRTASQAIGLREIIAWLSGESNEVQCRGAICAVTYRCARRQLAWFKSWTTFTPLCLSQGNSMRAVVERIAAETKTFGT